MEKEEEALSNNIQENSVKSYKSSSIQSSQNALQDNTDWISRLPDSLLIHILSRSRIEEVAKTSILSKRWRYLWTSLSCLDFTHVETGRKFEKTTFIDRFLLHHDESKVDKLCILAYILCIRHKVEELELNLFGGTLPDLSSDYTFYKVPHSLFRCGWVTRLLLCGCDVNLPTTIQFNSLKILCLWYIDLSPFAIEHITSNCPLLEDLYLKNCNKSIDLNICITNDNIKNLKILEFGSYECDGDTTITINAPNVISLLLTDDLPRTNYHVQQLRSLVIVDFYPLFAAIDDVGDMLCIEPTGYGIARLLHDLRYVKEYRLNSWCIQALTVKEIRGLGRMSINATCIKISLGLTKWELPGIAYLLQSSSYLEILDIDCWYLPEPELTDEFLREYDFAERDFWKLRELDSSSILQNTKTIKIRGFYSTFQVKNVKHWEREIELVRFLLKTSKVLERMIIETRLSSRNNIELVPGVARKLKSFPRASADAELFITSICNVERLNVGVGFSLPIT